jgi:hypothetical protein
MTDLSIDKVAFISHAMFVHRTMFIKPSMSHNHTQFTCEDKGANHSVPTCHQCGVNGHFCPNCFHIRSQKPRNKTRAPRKDESGFEEQVKKWSDQVKKEDNMCLVAHTALKILDTCLWYLDSGCSKHMTGDKTLLKEVQMGKGGRITYGDGSQSKVIGKGIIDIPGLGISQEALYVEGLKANLLNISQFCDNDLVMQFSKKECNRFDSSGNWLMGGERTADSSYGLPGLTVDPQIFCNKATIDDSELWHQRLGHLNFTDMLKIVVKDLPKMEKTGKGICGSCQLGKQTRAAHKKTSGIQTSRNLELLHMDLVGPTRTTSLGGRWYILVIKDDFSRYTWVIPLREKYNAFDTTQHLFKKIQVEQNYQIMRIRSDHGREFKNSKFEELCLSYGIKQEFSSPTTPQQNEVVERKNRVIQKMARVMIHWKNLAQHFWGAAVNVACHIINRVYLRPEINKTPYEIWRGKKWKIENWLLI